MSLRVNDEVCVGTDHGVITKISGRDVWYRSSDDGRERRTLVGHCTWMPPAAEREALQERIRDGWGHKERESRSHFPTERVEVTEVSRDFPSLAAGR